MERENTMMLEDFNNMDTYATVTIDDMHFMSADERKDPDSLSYNKIEAAGNAIYFQPFDDQSVNSPELSRISEDIVGAAQIIVDLASEIDWGNDIDTEKLTARKGASDTNNIDFYDGNKLIGRAKFNISVDYESYGLTLPNGIAAENLEHGVQSWDDLAPYEQMAKEQVEKELSEGLGTIGAPDENIEK